MYTKLKNFYENSNSNFKKIICLIYFLKINNKLSNNEIISLKKKINQNDEDIKYVITTLKSFKNFEDGINYFEEYVTDLFKNKEKSNKKCDIIKATKSFKNISKNEEEEKINSIYRNSIIDDQLYSKKVKNEIFCKGKKNDLILDKKLTN